MRCCRIGVRGVDAAGPRVEGSRVMELSPVETRVLGCLMEKERTTPEAYPLTLNSLIAACNQSTNRDPILTLGDREVEEALDELRQKKLATVIFGAGSRVQKYRHILRGHLQFLAAGIRAAVRAAAARSADGGRIARTRRAHGRVRAARRRGKRPERTDAEGDEPLVRLLPARPGQKERRYVQLLSGEPVEMPVENMSESRERARVPPGFAGADADVLPRVETLEHEVAELRAQIAELRESLAEFRRELARCYERHRGRRVVPAPSLPVDRLPRLWPLAISCFQIHQTQPDPARFRLRAALSRAGLGHDGVRGAGHGVRRRVSRR